MPDVSTRSGLPEYGTFATNLLGSLLFVATSHRWIDALERAHTSLPYLDSWETPALAVNRALQQGSGLQILRTLFEESRHNDSIKFVPVLIEYLVSAPGGYWNPASSIWLSAAAWIVFVLLALWLCCSQVSHPLARFTIIAVGCLVCFTPSSRFLVPFGLHRLIPLACCLGIAALLHLSPFHWWRLVLSLALAMVASLSFANGFLAFVVLLIGLLLAPSISLRETAVQRRRMTWMVAAVSTAFLTWYGFSLQWDHLKSQSSQHIAEFLPAKVIQAFTSWVSAPSDLLTRNAQNIFSHLGPDKFALEAGALVLGLALAFSTLVSIRPGPAHRFLSSRIHPPEDRRSRIFVVLLLAGFYAPTTLLLAQNRSAGLMDERYFCEIALLTILLTTTVFVLAGETIQPEGDSVTTRPNFSAVALSAVLAFSAFSILPLTFTSGYAKAMRESAPIKLRAVEHCLRTNDPDRSDLWQLCGFESISAQDEPPDTFHVLKQNGYWRRLSQHPS